MLELRDVSHVYPNGTRALDHVTLSIPRLAFDKSNVVLMERHPIRSGKQVLRFVSDKKPEFAGVDPYNFYIDRTSGDNVVPVN